MLNPEKILGGLLRGAPRGSSILGKAGVGSIGLGLLGIAMEAAEHYLNKPQGPRDAGMPPPPPGGAAPPVPPQVQGQEISSPSPAPATPPGPAAAPPPLPGGGSMPETSRETGDAVLLIRSMIAAANADGMIDEEERGRILEKLKTIDLSPEEHAFIVRELLSPCDLDTIVHGVKSPEMAKQVYMVSLMAIEVDTDAERDYIRELGQRLGLDEAARAEIHRELGVAPV
ncbi:MAG: tellurite resistance TerB family protein [Deltaproteobacteria bacterium]|nr:tellurite resistance TerB family protein [Deltaproteobacteria bacterium]